MTHITPVKSSNRCNIWPNKHRSSGDRIRKTFMICVLLVLLFGCSIAWFVLPAASFYLPPSDEVTASFSLSFETLPLSLPHSNAKLLHSYKTVTPLPSELQKILLSHPHPISRLRCQVYVSCPSKLTKHFSFKLYIIELANTMWNLNSDLKCLEVVELKREEHKYGV